MAVETNGHPEKKLDSMNNSNDFDQEEDVSLKFLFQTFYYALTYLFCFL